jgi:putative thioredoxin
MSEEATDKDFNEKVIERSKEMPIVVDFYADWCMPCKMLAPVLEKIAEEYKGKFVLVKVNVDNAPEIAQKYGIMSIPNVKMFKNGELISEFAGSYPESFIREWLEKNLSI